MTRNCGKALVVAISAFLVATALASPASAATPYISLSRSDGKLVVEGHAFPAYASGIIKAGIGTSGSYVQQSTKANSSGYFWLKFSTLDIASGGYTWARAWFNSEIHATTSHTFTSSSGSSSTTTSGTLAFQEDFNGTSLNTSRYGIYSGKGNQGIGWRSPSAVSIGNGAIKITGNGETAGGFAIKQAQTYGRYEIRAKLTTSAPITKPAGYNTAILLWPSSERWPVDGEIDVSEIFSGHYDRSCAFDHWGSDNQQVGYCQNSVDTSAWHTYAVDWRRDKLVYSIDGKSIMTVTNGAAIPDNQHFVGIQLDVANTSTHVSGTALSVDWVKIYK